MSLALLFDLDGTLMDTLDLIVAAMNAAAAEVNVAPAFRSEELRPMIGTPVQQQLDILRGITGESADAFADRYYANFTGLVDQSIRLFPGVRETFRVLAGWPIATMSTRRREQARRMLRAARLDPYFRAIVGGDEVARSKPNPDLPLHAARVLGVRPVDCVVVGDSPVDILAGRAAGMHTVAARYGYGDRNEIGKAKPEATIGSFSALPRVLKRLGAPRG